jgi:NADH dehydrogenase [ubiquinone] 1 alpha subcomplex assembly factor 7
MMSESALYPRLQQVLSPTPTAASTVLGLSSTRFKSLPIGATIEVSPASFKIAHRVAEVLSRLQSQDKKQHKSGGCALIVDYGDDKVFGNSSRVMKSHDELYFFPSDWISCFDVGIQRSQNSGRFP